MPANAGFCPNCGTPTKRSAVTPPPDASAVTMATPVENLGDAATMLGEGAVTGAFRAGILHAGEQVGSRYTIIRLLGSGGMGAVYQAFDHELGVAVAIKVIKPPADANAAVARELEQRFKRELVLARQITHKYVVRIHDLGEVSGLKYLTMPFVEGETLAAVLRREGKLPVPRVVTAARQIAQGLAAAHEKGIVHRDLKPENIMIESASSTGGEGGDALIMDFGIARSVHGGSSTAAGTVIGTMEYMAPEQAQGKSVDARADIYAFGLILYDMLLGRQRLASRESAMSELVARMAEAPAPPRSIDAEIPEALDRIVQRCIEPAVEARFATSPELVEALDALTPDGHPRTATAPIVPMPAVAPPQARQRWPLVAVALAVITIASGAGWWMSTRQAGPAAPVVREPISVLVAAFDNATGDPVFDGVLEQALALGIEGASFITAYPQRDALRSAAAIKPGSRLDEATARLVAARDGVKLVLLGVVKSSGSGYAMSVRAIDAADGREVVKVDNGAADKSAVLGVVGQMATSLRRGLGDSTVTAADAGRETFTAASLEAARAYVLAQDLAGNGKFAEAIAQYQEAVQRDPSFGRAYAGWANVAFRIGRPDEAEQLWKKSLTLLDRMTERERYRTLGGYYLGSGANDEQAVENYRALVEKYPSDGVGLNNLAFAYFKVLDFKRATEQGQRATAIFPRSAVFRSNLALYAMYASDFATAATEARRAIELSPFDKPYLAIAISALAAGKFDEASTAYADMAKVSTRGASIASLGRADLAMYQGQYEAARSELTAGAASDDAGKLHAPRALKLIAMAEASAATGGKDVPALIEQALALVRSDAVVVPAARLYVAGGRLEPARVLAADLEKQLQKRSRAMAGVVRAELALAGNRPIEAIDALIAARSLADLWLVRFTLGRAYVQAGKFAEALAELDACEKRIGEAADVFLDDWPTFRITVPLPYWLGRAQEGVGLADSAVKNYRAYLDRRGGLASDTLAADARARTAGK